MKAIVITGVGGPEVLEVREVTTPEPRGEQIRVRVRACGLNRADVLQTRGHYPAPAGVPADIPGLEYAGEVDALGPDVTGPLRVGDRVFGIVAGGAQAEYLVTHERMAVPIPADLDLVAAAAVPEVFITAHDGLISQGRLGPGEAVLIQAVGSGVGTAAAQIAHAMGCTVFGTSRTPTSSSKPELWAWICLSIHRTMTLSKSFASKQRAEGFRSCSTCSERECSQAISRRLPQGDDWS